jgi:hypothetical protein
MNKKLIILLLIILSFSLAGCGHLCSRFEVVENEPPDCAIFVDKETGVLYLRRGYGFTVLLDKDGKPLLYEGGPK